jgi:hypothetical protein
MKRYQITLVKVYKLPQLIISLNLMEYLGIDAVTATRVAVTIDNAYIQIL